MNDTTTQQVLLGGLGLVVALITLLVVIRQQQTMQGQLEIMKKQDELLARQANLIVVVDAKFTSEARQTCLLTVTVQNTGNKTARDFYWHFYVPVRNRHGEFVPTEGVGIRSFELQLEGIPHIQFAGLHRDPVYPTRKVALGTVTTLPSRPEAPLAVAWKLVSEDGAFPKNEEVGRLRLDL